MSVVIPEQNLDLTLIQRCQIGESDAFAELISNYQNAVYTYLYRFTGNEEDADIETINTFLRAYTNIQSVQEDESVVSWLLSIATNLARNEIDQTELPDAFSEDSREIQLQRHLVSLPDQTRTVFILKTFLNFKYHEIASTVDCPVGTVKARMNQARILLHEILTQ